MAHRLINIPGGNTSPDCGPDVRIVGRTDYPVSVTVRYLAGRTNGLPRFGEITFTNVLEYRWIADPFEYEDHTEHENDYEFGLIEIIPSMYIETMAAKGPLRHYPGERFGHVIKEQDVKHYRLGFEGYGRFDVIALAVSVRETTDDSN